MSELSALIQNAASQDWLAYTACADLDPSDFFVDAGHTIDPRVANVCRGCPVRRECLEWAYQRNINGGYFGGMSTGQRRQLTVDEAFAFIANDPVQEVPQPDDEVGLCEPVGDDDADR